MKLNKFASSQKLKSLATSRKSIIPDNSQTESEAESKHEEETNNITLNYSVSL